MKRTILVFGLISGVMASALMVAAIPLENKIGFDHSLYVGYTILVLSFLLVFFGIRSYRDNVAGGELSFVQGCGVGIAITLIACVFYVVAWEIVYFNFMHDYMDNYGAYMMAKAKAAGASPAALQAQLVQLKKLKEMYENPLLNGAMTFMEPFPVGLGVTLISALVLRRKRLVVPAMAG